MADNFTQLEKQAGRKAASILREALKNTIRSKFETTAGNSALLKSTVLSKMKGPELQRLVIKMPYYGFINHFGFEGVKANGVKMKLTKNEGFLSAALDANSALENLATEIGEIRADEVTANITF